MSERLDQTIISREEIVAWDAVPEPMVEYIDPDFLYHSSRSPTQDSEELYRSSRNGTKSRRDVVTREERGSERTGPPVGGRPLSTVPVTPGP